MKRVTIEEIARKVGVTKGLVSRALTGKSNVSEKMRDEIKRCAVSMGYDFSKLKTSTKTSKTCMLVMSSKLMLKEVYWRPIISAITTTLDFEHVNLEYFIYGNDISLEDVSKLSRSNADAYIFMHNNPEVLLNAIRPLSKIIVVIDPRHRSPKGVLELKYSNSQSFFNLIQDMVRLGHKNFLYYGPRGDIQSFRERLEGFRAGIESLKDLGVTSKELLFSEDEYSSDTEFENILNNNKEITAIFCANDLIASNAYKSIEKIGKKIPDDYSIVGFDNDDIAKDLKLTTVNVPRKELGEVAAKYVIRHLKRNELKYASLEIDCETIKRDSIKRKE